MVPGRSRVMTDIYQKLNSLAESDVNVLLIGETGTGKEMIARLLHLSGKRSLGPLVTVNCAAIPSDLAESELFGIGEKVATNVNQRKGKFTLADGGTLFLDELNAFPLPLQSSGKPLHLESLPAWPTEVKPYDCLRASIIRA